MSAAAPIPHTPTARVGGLRRLATVPNGDHTLVYFGGDTDDILRMEFATRIYRGRPATCLVGAKIIDGSGGAR